MLFRSNSDLDKFLVQAYKDAKKCDKKPLLAWKRSRKPWLVFILSRDIEDINLDFRYKLIYNKWTGLALDEFLKLEDDFFFDSSVQVED